MKTARNTARFFLAAVLALSAACATSHPAAPKRPRWNMSVDSKPAGAILLANRARGGRMSFEPIGSTPMTTLFELGYDDEFVKLQSGSQVVTLVPMPNTSIYVDFTTDPVTVVGAKLVGW